MNPWRGSLIKVAIISDDQRTISKHFGRAGHYVVLTIVNGQVMNRETRDKLRHSDFAGHEEHTEHEEHTQGHGFGSSAEHRHDQMLQSISDCQVLIAGGMGTGAYQSIRAKDIQPILTDVRLIDDAIRLLIDNRLKDHHELIHMT